VREVWVSLAYRLREAQSIVRKLGFKWQRPQRGEHYWIFPQEEAGKTVKLQRLGRGIWAIWGEKCE